MTHPSPLSQPSTEAGAVPADLAKLALDLLNKTQDALARNVANHRNPSDTDTVRELLGLHDCSAAYRVRAALASVEAPTEPTQDLLWGLLDSVTEELNRCAAPGVYLTKTWAAGAKFINGRPLCAPAQAIRNGEEETPTEPSAQSDLPPPDSAYWVNHDVSNPHPQPQPSDYSDIVIDRGMDPRNGELTPRPTDEQIEEDLFFQANLKDVYGNQPTYRERSLMLLAWKARAMIAAELDERSEQLTRYTNDPTDGLLASGARVIEELLAFAPEASQVAPGEAVEPAFYLFLSKSDNIRYWTRDKTLAEGFRSDTGNEGYTLYTHPPKEAEGVMPGADAKDAAREDDGDAN